MMKLPELNGFRLVGGTCLALYAGHRISVDLDFFTDKSFDVNELRRSLGNERWSFDVKSISKTGFAAFIDDVKCDFFNWGVPFIGEDVIEDGVRLCSLKDIAAFKLDAITTRKEKKDFWDIDVLLSHYYTFSEMFSFYRQKYNYSDIKIVLEALSEIDLADNTQEPVTIHQIEWGNIKQHIRSEWENFKQERIQKKEIEINERIKKAQELLSKKKPPQNI